MRHLFSSPFRTPTEQAAFDHEEVARAFIARLTGLVDELDHASGTLRTDAPATARHLSLVSQQMASLALTALETWPKIPRA
ncbi:hypothetical protein SCMU_22800 [Sinomonas cyclohexanicum]|uniref:Uncharacterized protein n=1 Tax=Sinomonas cyclohexanicum TaxID=322009 RepID=A0ABM7PVY3_SINCY|nr:hypothetical protein [Corynebacterium cyclohexanicum]BCT76438.1 hypothetical protein SCMU_22800 [Corynebacterium cyclohexanicum]